MSRIGKVGQLLPSLVFVVVAYLLAPKYLVGSFNSDLASSPQEFAQLIIVYYGLVSIPAAWTIFPSAVATPRTRSYVAPLLFAIFLVSARAATYTSFAYASTVFYNTVVGAVVLQALRTLLQKRTVERRTQFDPAILLPQLGAAFILFAVTINAELAMLLIAGAHLSFAYITAGTLGGVLAIQGLTTFANLRSAIDLNPRSLYHYVGTIPSSVKSAERPGLIALMAVETLLLVHVVYTAQILGPDLLWAAIFLGLNADSTASLLTATTLYAVAVAAFLALLVTPIWTNNRSRNMSEDQIQRILEITSVERTPLLLQDILSTMFSGLIKMELFLVVPIALLGVPRERLLSFPNENYILVVSIAFLIVGLPITYVMGRSKAVFVLSIFAAPISIIFSTSLEFFHVDLKRRLLRYYAKLQKQLPSIVGKLEITANNDRERLLLRLIAFYGLSDEEIVGSKRLLGVRPCDFDSSKRTLMLSFVDLRSKGVSQISLPLDDETTHLFENCTVGIASDVRIFQFSKSVLWAKIGRLAMRAGIPSWWQITPFRLRGHYIIFASRRLPSELREEMRLRKRF